MVQIKFVKEIPIINGTYKKDKPNGEIGYQKWQVRKTYEVEMEYETLYELEPAPGIQTKKIINLSDDIARSMSALSARISSQPGRNIIGIELPNKKRSPVYLSELLFKY